MWRHWIDRALRRRRAVTLAVRQSALRPVVTLPPCLHLALIADPDPMAGPWRALPGNVIELAATGFQIALVIVPERPPTYYLRSPEGALLAYGADLPGLKTLGERYAAEREEFTFRGATR